MNFGGSLSPGNLWRKIGFAAPPAAVRDQLLVIQYTHFRKNLPLLYITLIFGIISCSAAFSQETSIVFRLIIPALVGGMSCWRMLWWFVHRHRPVKASDARILIPRTAILSATIGTMCGIWSVFAWQSELSIFRYYIPAFMALGAFSTAYCLFMTPKIATYAVMSGVVPISTILLVSGTMLDFALSVTMLASMMFLIALIGRQYRQMLRMIELQQQMHAMAHTDSLTGLLNRRAFHEQLEGALKDDAKQDVTLVMLDLDGFKAINDQYGHNMGDLLLQNVARRMTTWVGGLASVARLGGDEFALLFVGKAPAVCQQATRTLIEQMKGPYHIEERALHIGVSYGLESLPRNAALNPLELINRADTMLYEMKSGRGEEVAQSSASPAYRLAG